MYDVIMWSVYMMCHIVCMFICEFVHSVSCVYRACEGVCVGVRVCPRSRGVGGPVGGRYRMINGEKDVPTNSRKGSRTHGLLLSKVLRNFTRFTSSEV